MVLALAGVPTGFSNTTAWSKLNYGNRDVVARYNGTSLNLDLELLLPGNTNKFTESGYDDASSEIIDQTQTCRTSGTDSGHVRFPGPGFVENTDDESYRLNVNTHQDRQLLGASTRLIHRS